MSEPYDRLRAFTAISEMPRRAALTKRVADQLIDLVEYETRIDNLRLAAGIDDDQGLLDGTQQDLTDATDDTATLPLPDPNQQHEEEEKG